MKTIIPLTIVVSAVCVLILAHSSHGTFNDASCPANFQSNNAGMLDEQLAAKRTELFLNNLNLIATR